jgi:Uma2 family endonuclease
MVSGFKNLTQKQTIPNLENGDRLTQVEFERRYSASTVKKAELIEGIVYMASPLRITQHGEPHAFIMGWLLLYRASTPGVQLGDNCTVRLDADNEPQPDALLRIEKGGQSTISEDGYVEGPPELIVEIAASSVSIDVHNKLNVYRRNQVQEYLVWRVEDEEIDWFRWKEGNYIQLQSNSEGIICSEVFPGLYLNKEALLTRNLIKVIEVLQQGLSTVDHQNFVEQLCVD